MLQVLVAMRLALALTLQALQSQIALQVLVTLRLAIAQILQALKFQIVLQVLVSVRLDIAIVLQFIVRRKANLIVGIQIGILQTALLCGDIRNNASVISAVSR